MHEIRVMGREGDTLTTFDPEVEAAVKEAERVFADARKAGYTPFAIPRGSTKGEQMSAFDPKVDRIVMVGPLRGG